MVYKKGNVSNGFTLIEMIVVILIISIVAYIGSQMVYHGFLAYTESRDITQATQDANFALQRMSKELRLANTFSGTSSSVLSFTDIFGTSHQFTLASNTINLQEDSNPAQPLASNITGMVFSYLDSAGQVTGTPADVYYVSISLTVLRDNFTVNMRTTIHPRNV